jgi:hypothetical protein
MGGFKRQPNRRRWPTCCGGAGTDDFPLLLRAEKLDIMAKWIAETAMRILTSDGTNQETDWFASIGSPAKTTSGPTSLRPMNAATIELYGLDLIVELDPPTANPLLTLASHSGTVREAGPAHAGQAEPIKVGDRVVVLAQSAKYLAVGGTKCALVSADALVWRFTE